MEKEQTKRKRQRKALLVLPLVTIPFLTLAFWSLGGGKDAHGKEPGASAGLNVHLPDPKLQEVRGQDKLSFYREAEKDAEKQKQQTGLDHYLSEPEALSSGSDRHLFDPAPYLSGDRKDPNEEKVYQKLRQLQREVQRPAPRHASAILPETNPLVSPAAESMLPDMSKSSEDPQLAQLNSMMDKILDIQHPERVKEKAAPAVKNGAAVYTVTKGEAGDSITLLEGESPTGGSATDPNDLSLVGFYSLEEPMQGEKQTAIQAVVHQTQTLESGAIILLRLAEAITVNGVQLPKGQLVHGAASLDGARLKIRITNIRYGNRLIPVQLHAYDLDGIEGLYTPGVRNREAAKGITQRAVQGLSLNTFGLSPGVQAAGVGIEAAKNLISRKVRVARVTVQQGYRLLLQNE